MDGHGAPWRCCPLALLLCPCPFISPALDLLPQPSPASASAVTMLQLFTSPTVSTRSNPLAGLLYRSAAEASNRNQSRPRVSDQPHEPCWLLAVQQCGAWLRPSHVSK
jgi:hypothetical protein